jgi:stearoyl-CoA desaturase (delta-9 desaturase)
VAWIVIVHLGALAAPFFFTWKALAICVFLSWFTGSIGVCMGYHRQLTHGSFNTYKPMRWLLAFIGGLSGEGSALTWVANHRKHHMFSDKHGDPHSPRDGKWWSHMFWFMPDFGRKHHETMLARFAPDLAKDPMMHFLHKMFLPSHVITGLVLFAVGYFGWNAYTGWSFVFWGMFVRLVYVLHVTWFVNSATHLWGYRNYETSDDSKNLWWVGLLAFGEGWHNNHHAFQRMAKAGHKWWEVDMTYWEILALEKVGLVWDVVKDPPKHGKPA